MTETRSTALPEAQKCTSSAWSTLRGTLKARWGECSLPPTVPSKGTLTGLISSLPPDPSRVAISEAASAFLFRKVLPATYVAADTLSAYHEKMGSPSPPRDPRFERAAIQAVRSLPKGWARKYSNYVESYVPSLKANLERVPPHKLRMHGFDPVRFRESCLGVKPPPSIPTGRRVLCLEDSGKARVVTIASFKAQLLGPLHHMLYDALVASGAVLRGPPTLHNLSAFKAVPNEVFVSGDYESATDSFNLNNTSFLLSLLRKEAPEVPESIWDAATEFMTHSVLSSDGLITVQQSGQLMGNLLSFPLLCLTNLAGLYLGLGPVRAGQLVKSRLVRINGDDIVFRCTLPESEEWMRACPLAGLKVSRMKTLVHCKVLTLNSTFFRARARKSPRPIWVVRSKSLTCKRREKGQGVREAAGALIQSAIACVRSHLVGSGSNAEGVRRVIERRFEKHLGKLLVVPDELPFKTASGRPRWRRFWNCAESLRGLRGKPVKTCGGDFVPGSQTRVGRPQSDLERFENRLIQQVGMWGRRKLEGGGGEIFFGHRPWEVW